MFTCNGARAIPRQCHVRSYQTAKSYARMKPVFLKGAGATIVTEFTVFTGFVRRVMNDCYVMSDAKP